MTINNGGESVQISGGSREDVDGRTDRFVWFYIGNNRNLFYLDGYYYSDQPTAVIDGSSTSWEDVPYSENYKSARLYTLNESTGRETSESGGAFNFETDRYANSRIESNQYVYFNGLYNEDGEGLYWYDGTFYTQPPEVTEGYGSEEWIEATEGYEGDNGRFYSSYGEIYSVTGMSPRGNYYWAGFGDNYVATDNGADDTGPITCWTPYRPTTDPDEWNYSGTIYNRNSRIDFTNGVVEYLSSSTSYYYDTPSSYYVASGIYTYNSGDSTYRITIRNGSFISHEEQTTSSTYRYSANNLLNGVFETGDDYDTGQWRYTFESGVLTNFEEWGTSHIEQDFSNPTNTSGKYTNFYFWTKYADISTGSSGSPQGNRITIYNNDENGQIEIRFNTSGVLTTVNKRRTPTATYNDRFMFRCNDLWRDGSWSGDGLIFIDGLLWQTSTHLGE